MKPITKKELLLTVDLLEMAADTFSNHGCNDFDLGAYLSTEECNQLNKDFHEWNGDPEEYDEEYSSSYSQDWLLMRVMAEKLKELAEKMND